MVVAVVVAVLEGEEQVLELVGEVAVIVVL